MYMNIVTGSGNEDPDIFGAPYPAHCSRQWLLESKCQVLCLACCVHHFTAAYLPFSSSPGDLVKIWILVQEVWVSNKHPGGADAAIYGPETTL